MLISLGSADAGAVFSPCKQYRYQLWRRLSRSRRSILWLMLNPSTADHKQLDPTVTRCYRYSQQWRYGNFLVANIFAFRATDPKHMYAAKDPVGPANDEAILQYAKQANLIVLGWGNHGCHRQRSSEVMTLLCSAGYAKKLHCLKINNSGEPCHPLYLRADLKPLTYPC